MQNEAIASYKHVSTCSLDLSKVRYEKQKLCEHKTNRNSGSWPPLEMKSSSLDRIFHARFNGNSFKAWSLQNEIVFKVFKSLENSQITMLQKKRFAKRNPKWQTVFLSQKYVLVPKKRYAFAHRKDVYSGHTEQVITRAPDLRLR